MVLLLSVVLTLGASWAQEQVKPCDLPEIKHGSLYNEDGYKSYFPAALEDWFHYSCNENYVTRSGSYWDYITCTRHGWTPAVPCRRKCIFNNLENGVAPENKKEYLQGESLRIDCHPGYSLPNQQTSVICTEDGWSPPPVCHIKYCGMPVFANATAVITGARLVINDTLDYKCLDGYENRDGNKIGSMVCSEDGWIHLPTCYKSTEKCERPPSISNGDITSFLFAVYLPGSRVKYQCQAYYELQGSKYVTCNDGKWSEPPRCIDPCVISEQNMNTNNIQLKGKDNTTYFVKAGELVEFVCKSGHTAATSQQSFQVVCGEGTLEYPRCE